MKRWRIRSDFFIFNDLFLELFRDRLGKAYNFLHKIQLFLYKCYHHSIGVKTRLSARGVDMDTLYPYVSKHRKLSFMLSMTVQWLDRCGLSWEKRLRTLCFMVVTFLIGWKTMVKQNMPLPQIKSLGDMSSSLPSGLYIWLKRNLVVLHNK